MSGGLRPLHVVWFKRDLRIADHAPLTLAALAGPVLPLYIVEPDLWRQPDTSMRQWRFLQSCLNELRNDLAAIGRPLVIRTGDALDVLQHIAATYGIAALWSHEETGNAWTFARDKVVAEWALANAIPWHERRQHGVERRMKSRDGWAQRWDRFMAEPIIEPPRALAPIDANDHGQCPEPTVLGLVDDGFMGGQIGGRAPALDLLHSFLESRGANYRRAMSNPLEGAAACSRLSPYLAYGTISMREVMQATWARQRELKAADSPRTAALCTSLASFSSRLHWHCHFIQKLESEPEIEFREFHPALRGLRPAPVDQHYLTAWMNGETGFPFLDACMRSLRATGWLNFRMRAMVMSFASYNLWLPWRETGLHLARMFVDYEPGIHWSQVQMQSGTTGINSIRIYNVVKQGYDQDPEGVFVRRWIPELHAVPDCFIHEPWRWDEAARRLGRSYPAPIVDLKDSSRSAKERIYGARKGRRFHDAADAIQDKHGSRKSGLLVIGRKQGRAKNQKKNVDATQLDFDL
jgi:deoxyribodipyrimidine photo-lyase